MTAARERGSELWLTAMPAPSSVPAEDAGALLRITRTLAYELVRRGEIPSLGLGRGVVVPAHALRLRVGIVGTDDNPAMRPADENPAHRASIGRVASLWSASAPSPMTGECES
jgi:hypothetical protein